MTRHSTKIAAALLIGALGVAPQSRANQDTILPIRPDGQLSRIPDEYGPVALLVSGSVETPTVSLKFAARDVLLPPCLSRLFFLPEGENIRAKGSWSHSRSLLPPYVSFDLPRKTVAHGFFTGHSLRFNLETGVLIEISQHAAHADGTGATMVSLPLDPPCDPGKPFQLRPAIPDSQTSTINALE